MQNPTQKMDQNGKNMQKMKKMQQKKTLENWAKNEEEKK